MNHVWLIFLLGAFGIYKAIPVGFVLEMDPVVIALTTSVGAVVALFAIYFFGKKIKRYILARMEKKSKLKGRSERFNRIFDKYGAAGVGLLGTIVFGPNLTMMLGLIVVKKEIHLLIWTMIGAVAWTVVLTIIATYSIELFNALQII